jgi:hypothetical protein
MSAAMVQKFPTIPPHIQKSPPSSNKKYFAVIFTVVTPSFSPHHGVDNFNLKIIACSTKIFSVLL